jgi:quercetin dioxygenase-like cupin family protein
VRFDHYESGALFGVKYTFEKGEGIPAHAHPHELLHNVIVLKGSVAFESENAITYLVAGDVFDFDGSKTHTITALESAVILNGFLHGKPAEYADLTEADKHG